MDHEPDAEETRDCPPPADCRPPRRWWQSSGFVSIRDAVLFASGLGVIGWEVFAVDLIRPVVLLVGAAMAGLPLVFDPRRP